MPQSLLRAPICTSVGASHVQLRRFRLWSLHLRMPNHTKPKDTLCRHTWMHLDKRWLRRLRPLGTCPKCKCRRGLYARTRASVMERAHAPIVNKCLPRFVYERARSHRVEHGHSEVYAMQGARTTRAYVQVFRLLVRTVHRAESP